MKEENGQNQRSYVPSKYSKALTYYTKTQVKVVMPFLISIAQTSQYSSQYPVCKVLRAVSKIFLLNEIEVIFLAYLINQTKWDIKEKTIHNNAQHVQDIVCYAIENFEYKRLILYLLLTAYTVKYYLNEKTNEALEEAVKRCPNFQNIFKGWAKKHSSITTKINPRTLNTVYKFLFQNIRNEKPDFNIMVDAILQISPAYNPEKPSKETDKKKFSHKQCPKKQQQSLKQQISGFFPAPPLFSSSGILTLRQFSNQQCQRKQSVNASNPFLPYKSTGQDYRGMLGSSVFKGINNVDIKDEDCGQIVLGLQEGQSEENLYFEQNRNIELPPPNTSVISLNVSKALSLGSKYISTESKVLKRNGPSE